MTTLAHQRDVPVLGSEVDGKIGMNLHFIRQGFPLIQVFLLQQVSYAIGIAEPISISVFDYGTSTKTQDELLEIIKKNFDLRPGKIVK
ncbi:S-adenosylmethionine synthase [Blattella germanica]|nr:S-adenosylmethionine synthase [Blattella germanica]